jgi:hypothetical protein
MATYIVKEKDEETVTKDILLFDRPEPLTPIIHPLGWKILLSLAQNPAYPAQIARDLKLYRQKVYYHTQRLERAGFIKASKVKAVKGGLAKYYVASHSAFGVELPFGEEKAPRTQRMDSRLEQFCNPIIDSGVFNGVIVVGSPEPHGPNKTIARDGHYGVPLALFLGQYCRASNNFIVKLDVDVKTEKEEDCNMILIGGPGTNLITTGVNEHLPIRFNDQNYWGGLSDRQGGVYTYDRDGVVAKIPNPIDHSKRIIVLAGNRHLGTKAAVIAFTKFWDVILNDYEGEDAWAVAVRGFDMDGDGKIDSAEVVS